MPSTAHEKAGVLIVDNERPRRRPIEDLFRRRGYRVRSADNGAHALQVLRSGWLPRLIVTELRMPIFDGPELYAELMADECWRHVPIFLVSDHPDLPRASAMRGVVKFGRPLDAHRFLTLADEAIGEAPRAHEPRSAGARRSRRSSRHRSGPQPPTSAERRPGQRRGLTAVPSVRRPR